jgi:hypothetical protein
LAPLVGVNVYASAAGEVSIYVDGTTSLSAWGAGTDAGDLVVAVRVGDGGE